MNPFSDFIDIFNFGTSSTRRWIPYDYKEIFDENLKKYPDSVHIQNYKKNPIEYNLNNYGFRTPDDFNKGDVGTVYLGCSHTFGIGHHLENIWPYKLHQEVGEGKFFNLSHGATGFSEQYYFLKYFSDKLKIKKVFHYYPSECNFRYMFITSDGKIRGIAPFNEKFRTKLENKIWRDYLINDTHNDFHNKVHNDAIKNVCKEIGCDYIQLNKSYVKDINPYHTELTPARDLLHYYVEEHDDIYNNFLTLS